MLKTVITQRSPLSFATRTYAYITRLSGFPAAARRAQTVHFIEQAKDKTQRNPCFRAKPAFEGKSNP